jgi:hypothetical protein
MKLPCIATCALGLFYPAFTCAQVGYLWTPAELVAESDTVVICEHVLTTPTGVTTNHPELQPPVPVVEVVSTLRVLAVLKGSSRISDRVRAGLARAKAQGIRLGRPRVRIAGHKLAAVQGLTVSEAAQRLGVSRSTAHRMMVRSLKAQEGSPA